MEAANRSRLKVKKIAWREQSKRISNVCRSYVLTAAKYDFSVYEKQIMLLLTELAQQEIEGIKFKDNLSKITPTNLGREIVMPVWDILRNERRQEYTIATNAFKKLSEKHIEYEDRSLANDYGS